MWPVPPNYLLAVVNPHSHRAWAEVYLGDVLVAENVQIISGSVTTKVDSDVRYTATVELNYDIKSSGDLPEDILNIYSTRIALFTSIPGIADISPGSSGEAAVVPVGVYRVEDTNRTDLGIVTLTLGGLEGYIIDDEFLVPRAAAPGSKVVDVITALIQETLINVDVVVEIGDSEPNPEKNRINKTVATAVPFDRKRWDAIEILADTIDCEVFAGADGKFHIRDRPAIRLREDWDTSVEWTISRGDQGALTALTTAISRTDVYNGVLAYNESVDGAAPTAYALVKDDDPDSPVKWGGPFGRKPVFISNTEWVTTDQCTWAAIYALNDAFGYNRKVSFSGAPNYALEPNDFIYLEGHRDVLERHLVLALTLPLTHDGSMAVETKAKSDLRFVTWEELPTSAATAPTNEYTWDRQIRTWKTARAIDTDVIQ